MMFCYFCTVVKDHQVIDFRSFGGFCCAMFSKKVDAYKDFKDWSLFVPQIIFVSSLGGLSF